MENIFANLFAPEAKVCGTWLRRYTLWNHALLSAFDSPLLSSDPEATFSAGDLLWNVELCRVTYPHLPRVRPPLRRAHWQFLIWNRHNLRTQPETFAAWISTPPHGPVYCRDASGPFG